MPVIRYCHLLALALFLCLSALLPPSVSAAPEAPADGDAAGMVLSVTPEAWAEADGDRTALAPKTPVRAMQSVVTGPTGKAQILFQDDTTLAVAPDSRVDIKDFVFTPTQSKFELGLNNGLVRVVSGEIVRRNPAAFGIRTPEAHVGVRGTTFSVSSAGGRTTILLVETSGPGVMVTNLSTGQTSILNQVGFVLEVTPDGFNLRPATPAEMEAARQAARDNTPAALAPAPAAPLNLSPKGGNSPAGPADNDVLVTENVAAAPLSGPGLNVNDISGSFAANGTATTQAYGDATWSAGFDVGLNTAAISNATLSILQSSGSAPTTLFDGTGGSGSIQSNGAFTVTGINSPDNTLGVDTTTMNGQFTSVNGGNLNWAAKADSATAATGSGAFNKQ